MIEADNLRHTDFAVISDTDDTGFHIGVDYGIQGAAAQHSEDAPQAIDPLLAQRSASGSRAVAQEAPADAKKQADDDQGADGGRLYA